MATFNFSVSACREKLYIGANSSSKVARFIHFADSLRRIFQKNAIFLPQTTWGNEWFKSVCIQCMWMLVWGLYKHIYTFEPMEVLMEESVHLFSYLSAQCPHKGSDITRVGTLLLRCQTSAWRFCERWLSYYQFEWLRNRVQNVYFCLLCIISKHLYRNEHISSLYGNLSHEFTLHHRRAFLTFFHVSFILWTLGTYDSAVDRSRDRYWPMRLKLV